MSRFRAGRNWITLTTLRTVLAGLIAVALLASAGFGTHRWVSDRHAAARRREAAAAFRRGHCAASILILRRDGQCIGVTDGGFPFAGPQLTRVERAILAQNRRIIRISRASHQPYATIALLLPMTGPDAAAQTEILHDVQGAYAAQYQADNHSNSQAPGIRLVLANPGVDSTLWPAVVRQLARMTAAPDNLRSVAGISVSTDQTEAEVHELTARYGIPVVTGAPTANDFANPPTGSGKFPGLARVSPSDGQEAVALTRFAGATAKYSALVADNRNGDTADDYITSLAQSYSGDTTGQVYSFTSPEDESDAAAGDLAGTFSGYAADICSSDVRWIYFAGRQVQLRLFLNAIAGRCRRKITIITGDAAAHLATDTQLPGTDFTTGEITLDYPAIASPAAWPDGSRPAGGSAADFSALTTGLRSARIGPVGPLTDGETIINYDAVLTAVYEIRKFVAPMPSLAQVALARRDLSVPGSSGTICLDANGNPYNKAIDVMQYPAKANAGFVKLMWPLVSPADPGCSPPRGS